MRAFDLYWSQLMSLIKFAEHERTMQRGVHLNKSRILFLLLLFCCFVSILFISFRDSMKVLVRNRFPCITWDVSSLVRFTMLGLSCVRSKFEYLCGSLKETNLKKVYVTTITISALGASLALTICWARCSSGRLVSGCFLLPWCLCQSLLNLQEPCHKEQVLPQSNAVLSRHWCWNVIAHIRKSDLCTFVRVWQHPL